jgi:hypothetical protein
MSGPSTLPDRISAYLSGGGLFNPEMADHDAVRDLLIECRDALAHPTSTLRQEACDAAASEPVAWQWRKKGDPWTLERTFNSEVFATTDDTEVRALYASLSPAPQASPDEWAEFDVLGYTGNDVEQVAGASGPREKALREALWYVQDCLSEYDRVEVQQVKRTMVAAMSATSGAKP